MRAHQAFTTSRLTAEEAHRAFFHKTPREQFWYWVRFTLFRLVMAILAAWLLVYSFDATEAVTWRREEAFMRGVPTILLLSDPALWVYRVVLLLIVIVALFCW